MVTQVRTFVTFFNSYYVRKTPTMHRFHLNNFFLFREGDLRVIRPLVHVREKELRNFAEKVSEHVLKFAFSGITKEGPFYQRLYLTETVCCNNLPLFARWLVKKTHANLLTTEIENRALVVRVFPRFRKLWVVIGPSIWLDVVITSILALRHSIETYTRFLYIYILFKFLIERTTFLYFMFFHYR